MDKKLIRAVAADITRAIVERIRWEREEQMAEAFEEFFPVVYCRIDEYEAARKWRRTKRRGGKQSEQGERGPDSAPKPE